MSSQGFLFTEPSIAETGVWCEISHGIDPAQWAFICRFIGKLSPREFEILASKVKSKARTQEVRVEELFEYREVPLISIGCSGIGGEYQREVN